MNISRACVELFMYGIFNYSMPWLDFSQIDDCDSRWKAMDGTVLGLERYLIREWCESGISYNVRCDGNSEMVYTFTVFNSTSASDVADPVKDHMNLVYLIIPVFAVIGLLYYCIKRFLL